MYKPIPVSPAATRNNPVPYSIFFKDFGNNRRITYE